MGVEVIWTPMSPYSFISNLSFPNFSRVYQGGLFLSRERCRSRLTLVGTRELINGS